MILDFGDIGKRVIPWLPRYRDFRRRPGSLPEILPENRRVRHDHVVPRPRRPQLQRVLPVPQGRLARPAHRGRPPGARRCGRPGAAYSRR